MATAANGLIKGKGLVLITGKKARANLICLGNRFNFKYII